MSIGSAKVKLILTVMFKFGVMNAGYKVSADQDQELLYCIALGKAYVS